MNPSTLPLQHGRFQRIHRCRLQLLHDITQNIIICYLGLFLEMSKIDRYYKRANLLRIQLNYLFVFGGYVEKHVLDVARFAGGILQSIFLLPFTFGTCALPNVLVVQVVVKHFSPVFNVATAV